MTIMAPKDTKGNQLYSESMQGMDPKYPHHGLSNDHLMPKRNDIQDVANHPVDNRPRPMGGGQKPQITPPKKMIDDSSHFGKGNKAKPQGQASLHVGS